MMDWPGDPLAVNLLVSLVSLHPLWRIFRRAGLNPVPSLLIVVPVFGWAIVGSLLAFQRWPNVAPRRKKAR
jgi:hypothetical protein